MQKIKLFTSDEIVSMDNFNDRIRDQNSNIDIINNEINKLDGVVDSLDVHTSDRQSHVTQADKTKWDNISNPNILINGDFRVWQRGDRINTEKNKWIYTADRFRVNGVATIEKTNKGLYVSYTSGRVQIQYILDDADYTKLLGKKITVSYCKNDIEYILYSTEVAGQVIFSMELDRWDTLNWVKAEIGDTATPYQELPYAEELARCQRYYRETPFMVSGHKDGDYVNYSHSNKMMRIEPHTVAKSIGNHNADKVDLIVGTGSSIQATPYAVMSNVNISRVILGLPTGYTGMQGILTEDAEIY